MVTRAWAVPARTRTVTAIMAQRDQTGKIAASSLVLAWRSRYPNSVSRPPSQTAMAPRWAASATVVSTGTDEAAGWPDTGQVARPTTASTATSARSVQPAFADSADPGSGRLTNSGSSTVSAAITPMRTRCAAPYWLLNTSRRSAAVAPKMVVPAW